MSRVLDLARPLADRGFRQLWASQVLSEIGDWAARLALVVLVMDRSGSAAWAGAAVGASLVAWLGPGQLVAGLVDHLDRRTVMVGADLVRAAAFLLLLVPAPVGVTVALAAVAGLASPAFAGARSAAQVELVDPDRYGPSVALTGITQDVTVLVGYLLGALALGVGDPSTALAVNAVTFVASAAVLTGLPPLPSRDPASTTGTTTGGTAGATGGAGGTTGAAVAVVLGDATVRRAVVLTLGATFSATASETLLVVWAVRDLGGASWLAPVLLAATTALTLVGTARVALDGSASSLLRTTARLTALPALAVAGLAAAGWAATLVHAPDLVGGPVAGSLSWWVAAALGVAAFVVAGLLFVATTPANVVGGPRLPRELRAVAISVIVGATTAGQALAAVVAGGLAELVPVLWALVLVMVPAVLVGGACLVRQPAEPTEQPHGAGDAGPAEDPSAVARPQHTAPVPGVPGVPAQRTPADDHPATVPPPGAPPVMVPAATAGARAA
ncbi:hypothetical protein [Aquipuribacter hungaricus]|uniref:MFS transporter n=1 Tax=Aquipuribacter hungaricus TaxID=545624 RepID=A0ABV7WMA5_9MICO